MKKILPILISTVLLAIPVVVLAVDAPTIFETPEELEDKIGYIGNIIFTVLLAVAAICLIIAGFQFVTAGGDPEKVNSARRMLINALIGVAVALAAKGLVELVRNILGG